MPNMASDENIAFTERVIKTLMPRSIEGGLFEASLTDYLISKGRIVWDDLRALFWVAHPSAGPQVAVWLMPVALKFVPQRKGARDA